MKEIRILGFIKDISSKNEKTKDNAAVTPRKVILNILTAAVRRDKILRDYKLEIQKGFLQDNFLMGLFISQEIKEEKTKNQELKGLCFMKLLTEVVCAPKKIKRQAHTKDNFRHHPRHTKEPEAEETEW